MSDFDLIVIGSGPGGYVAALRAAQGGLKVACIEKDEALGGTCLNVGCIPSKALLYSTERYEELAKDGEKHGILSASLDFSLEKMMERKRGVVKKLGQGIDFLFKKNGVTKLLGKASFVEPLVIEVDGKRYSSKKIIIATGSSPMELPFLPFDEKKVLSSTGALSLKAVPKKMLLIGAGVIGLELGSVYRRLGSEIEVVELLDRITPTLDRELSSEMQKSLERQGMRFHLSQKVVGADLSQGVRLELEKGVLEGDVVLVGIGRRPYTEGLSLERGGVLTNQAGQIIVDEHFQTKSPGIYAIGDVIDGPMLAHKAEEEAIALIDSLLGKEAHVHYYAIPNVMYTHPEVASVGFSEEEAKEAALEILTGKAFFKGNSRARCSMGEEGFVKVIAEKKSLKVIGIHIMGEHASEMIGEGVCALEAGMSVKALAALSHAHPTLSETIKEAAYALLGRAIHS